MERNCKLLADRSSEGQSLSELGFNVFDGPRHLHNDHKRAVWGCWKKDGQSGFEPKPLRQGTIWNVNGFKWFLGVLWATRSFPPRHCQALASLALMKCSINANANVCSTINRICPLASLGVPSLSVWLSQCELTEVNCVLINVFFSLYVATLSVDR